MNEEAEVGRLLAGVDVPAAPAPEFTRRLRHQVLDELRGEHASRGHDVGVTPVLMTSRASSPDASSLLPPRHQRRPNFPALGAVAGWVLSIAVVILLVVPRAFPTDPGAGSTMDYDVYLAGDSPAPIDPTTLSDVDPAPQFPAEFAEMDGPVAVSADGSTVAVVKEAAIEDRDGYRVSVIDTRTGAERVTIPWPYPVESVDLSADGSRLVVGTMSGTMDLGPGWHLYDTDTGVLLGQISSGATTETSWAQVLRSWMDPKGERLYRLMAPVTYPAADPSRQEYLLVDDLVSGEEIGRVDLPALRAGLMPFPADPDNGVLPGVALSADGRRIAIVHADDERITIVNVEGLVLDRTIDLKRPERAVEGALTWLGLVPRQASAKGTLGVDFAARFAPDGRYLYVWDRSPERISAEGDRLPTDRRGLQVIDLTTGTIITEGLADNQILDVVPAPDGGSILVIIATAHDARGQPVTFALRRVTPDLSQTAERIFGFEPHVAIVMRHMS